MKKVFFTGSNGFIGSHLIPYLKNKFGDIYFHEYLGKIESYAELETDFKKENWDFIFHFAGLSHVSDCENSPQLAYEVNTLGTLFVTQLIQKYNFTGTLFFTSTALIFDFEKNTNGIISESSPLAPASTYAKTKYYSEKILENFSSFSSCHICVLRLFNHTHKSQSPKFVLPSVYQQVENAKDGDVIKIGNLYVERDFSLVSDFTEKMYQLLKHPMENKFQIYNLSSGVGRNLNKLVNLIISKSGKKLKLEMQSELLRKNDPPKIVGKFKTSYNSILTDEQFVDHFLSQ